MHSFHTDVVDDVSVVFFISLRSTNAEGKRFFFLKDTVTGLHVVFHAVRVFVPGIESEGRDL